MRRPFPEVRHLGGSAHRSGLIDCGEGAEVQAFPADVDVGHPTVAVASHAWDTACVVPVGVGAVPSVLSSVSDSQVRTSIVEYIAVLVIHADRVARRHRQDDAGEYHAGLPNSWGAAHALLAEVPLDAADQRYVGGVDDGTGSVEPNLNVGDLPYDVDPGRFVTPSTLPGGWRG